MHRKTKQMAFSGVLAAVTILLLFLGNVLQMNTLFFTCGAAFCVGIAIREWGTPFGAMFLVATTLLAWWILPKKTDCFLFAIGGLYLVLSEWLWNHAPKRKWFIWVGRYLIFNLLYLPAVLFLPQLFVATPPRGTYRFLLWAVGQPGLFIFEKAHEYFQLFIWNKFRRILVQ